MCLILLALRAHEDYPFIVLANRDEFFDRPTLAANLWPGDPEIAAGRDLLAGGTWLGLSRQGIFATITNYKEMPPAFPSPFSRGQLVLNCLLLPSKATTRAALHPNQLEQYSGFNLVHGDISKLWWITNRSSQSGEIPRGVSGLSNHLLNTPWHKVSLGKSLLRETIAGTFNADDLLSILANTEPPQSSVRQNLNIGTQPEGSSLPIFVASDRYGTRSSTVILVSKTNQVSFIERTYSAGAQILGETYLNFTLEDAKFLPETTTMK